MESFPEAMQSAIAHGEESSFSAHKNFSPKVNKSRSVKSSSANGKVQSNILQFGIFFLVVFAVVAALSRAIPPIVEKTVIATLVPAETKIVNFNGVFASPTSEGTKLVGAEVARPLVNGEVIVDFTNRNRTREQHGFTKASNEWLIKTPIMGDEAVVLSPSIAFIVPLIVIGVLAAAFLTMLFPPSFGLFAALAERTFAETRMKLLFQTGFSEELVDFLLLSDAEVTLLAQSSPERVNAHLQTLWEATRTEHERQHSLTSFAEESVFDSVRIAEGHHAFVRNTLVDRMKEAFSLAVVYSIRALQSARVWKNNRWAVMNGIRLYMSEHFAPNRGNSVQGLAYAGAGLMIVVIGLRGLRFIPASRPSMILASLSLECALLMVLGLTLYFQREEGSSAESLKRIENNTQNVALVMSSVDSSTFQRAMHEAIRERIQSPEMDKRLAESLTQSFIESLRTSPQHAKAASARA